MKYGNQDLATLTLYQATYFLNNPCKAYMHQFIGVIRVAGSAVIRRELPWPLKLSTSRWKISQIRQRYFTVSAHFYRCRGSTRCWIKYARSRMRGIFTELHVAILEFILSPLCLLTWLIITVMSPGIITELCVYQRARKRAFMYEIKKRLWFPRDFDVNHTLRNFITRIRSCLVQQ